MRAKFHLNMINSNVNQRRELQVIESAGNRFGIFTEEIAAVVPWQEPAPLPHAPASVLGVVSVQGRMLTVIDLRALMAESTNHAAPQDQKIVALRGDEQLALAVDAIGDKLQVSNKELQAETDSNSALVQEVLREAGTPIKILNTKQLFPTAIQGRERRRRRF